MCFDRLEPWELESANLTCQTPTDAHGTVCAFLTVFPVRALLIDFFHGSFLDRFSSTKARFFATREKERGIPAKKGASKEEEDSVWQWKYNKPGRKKTYQQKRSSGCFRRGKSWLIFYLVAFRPSHTRFPQSHWRPRYSLRLLVRYFDFARVQNRLKDAAELWWLAGTWSEIWCG